MDRISALRNIEDALTAYEDGNLQLPELEHEVRSVLRTYATEFDEATTAYRARGEPPADGLVVVARSPRDAREQIEEYLSEPVMFDIEQIE
jgi:hypothetical protein